MTISINDSVCSKYGLKEEELLTLLLIKSGVHIPAILEDLEKSKKIVRDVFGNYLITQRWNDVADSVILDSDKDVKSDSYLEELALKLAAIFPKEKKTGTCHYFRGNKKDNILKLKKFFKLYGNTYTEEQILTAAKNYVDSFNGNYQYMRILKYFIWKDEIKINADGKKFVEETSDLASWIENAGQEECLSNDWTSTLK